MAVLAAVREGEARRIGEAARRAVDHLGDQRQRLQGPRPEIFQQQQRREIAQLAFIGDASTAPSRFKSTSPARTS